MARLTGRSCVARQEPYIPGALSILQGTVPGRVRGSGHMVPTYFRRELRDRVLQRPSRLRTFFVVELFPEVSPPLLVIPRESGVSSTPRLLGSIAGAAEYWITAGACHLAGRRPDRVAGDDSRM